MGFQTDADLKLEEVKDHIQEALQGIALLMAGSFHGSEVYSDEYINKIMMSLMA